MDKKFTDRTELILGEDGIEKLKNGKLNSLPFLFYILNVITNTTIIYTNGDRKINFPFVVPIFTVQPTPNLF